MMKRRKPVSWLLSTVLCLVLTAPTCTEKGYTTYTCRCGDTYRNGGTVWTSGVLGYSIGAYCASQASKGADVAPLAEATAVYGYHAKQYFG